MRPLAIAIFSFGVVVGFFGFYRNIDRTIPQEPLVGATVLFPTGGGTGTSTTPSANSILIGSATGRYDVKTLTAGANVTITNSGSTVTISSSGGSSGSPFPFSAFSWGVATGTTVGFGNGLIANASSTFTSSLAFTNFISGSLAVNSTGGVYKAATTTFNAPLSVSNGSVTLSTAGTWSGNAVTASALAANGTNCSAGNYPLGVDASGNAETCTAASTGTVTAVSVASANGFGGSSSGGATPALTLTTSITGLLKGNGSAISAAALTDFPTQAAGTVIANGTGSTAAPSAVSTSTLYTGAAGQVLAFLSGSWQGVATTTFSAPLTYSNGAVSLTTSGTWTGNAGTATALAANGTNCSAGNYPLGVDASGNAESCTAAVGGAATYDFPLAGNATSTLTQFNNGLTAYGTSTIGDSNLGLTINGTGSTTGRAYFGTTIGIGTTSPTDNLFIKTTSAMRGLTLEASAAANPAFISYQNPAKSVVYKTGVDFDGSYSVGTTDITASRRLTLLAAGQYGVGSTTPYATLSVFAGGSYAAQALSTVFAIGSSTAGVATSTLLTVLSSGNVGIGTAAPLQALDVTGAIAISGTVRINSSGTFVGAVGTIAGPSFSFNADLNDGIFHPATDEIGFVTNGIERVRFNSIGSSGFGTTSPWGKLSINSSVNDTVGQPLFVIASSTAGGTASTTQFIVTSGGGVGIGTSSPFAAFTVARFPGFASSSILVYEYDYGRFGNIATSTAANIDCRTANTHHWPIGASATTLTLVGLQPGSVCKVIVENPSQTAGALTWAAGTGYILAWPGGTVPTQTTTANKMDLWSFTLTQASSSQVIIGQQAANI